MKGIIGKCLLLVPLLVVLTGCGGGGGDNSNPAPAPQPTSSGICAWDRSTWDNCNWDT